MKIIYAGTPEFAVPALQALAASRHDIVAVYTQPDRAAGRGRKLQPSAVKSCALQHGLTVIQPQSFKEPQAVEQLQAFAADLMVVAAYGLLLPSAVLQAPRLGCINIHASLLPRWRGAAPIQRAILAGDRETGITLMQMDEGLDTGKMLAKSTMQLDENMTAAFVHDELKQLGAGLLMDTIGAIEQGTLQPEQQEDAQACYARKLSKQEAEIDWQKSAQILHREIRAFNPWPVSFTRLHQQSVKIWSASYKPETVKGKPGQIVRHDRHGMEVCCGQGVLIIDELQFAGKKRTSAAQVFNARDLTDEVLGE